MKTVASATDNNSVVVKGSANDMVTTLKNGDNPNYQKVDQKTAEANAANGGLSLAGVKEGVHGHVLTFSVGSNVQKGKVANIGSKQYSGFTSLNFAINKAKPKSYFILKGQ